MKTAIKQDNFELNDKEKITLFKSANKLLVAHSNDIHQTWLQMCNFLQKCQVNLFEMKDQRGEGIEHRLIKAWPIPFDRSSRVNKILAPAMN